MKPALADNIRAGERLTGADIARAFERRTTLAETMRQFFQQYDVLVLPTSQVPPFPADQEYPTEIAGQSMETYLDWMRSAYLITVTGCPAISVPGGRTPDGLPVGVQLVAPHGQDRRLLEIAAGFEAAGAAGGSGATGYVRRRIWGQPRRLWGQPRPLLGTTRRNQKYPKKVRVNPLRPCGDRA